MVLVQQQRRRHKGRRSNAQFRPIFWSGTICFCSAFLFLVIFLLYYYAVLRTLHFVSAPSAAPLEEDWQLILSSDPPYNRFAPKLDVVWARGWYGVLDPPDNVPLYYYNHPGRTNGQVNKDKWDEYFTNNPKLCVNQDSTNYIWLHASELVRFTKLLDQRVDCKNITLISGEADSDIGVYKFSDSILDRVHSWYSQNVAVEHPRLFPIPLGLPIHYGLPGSPDSIDTLQQMAKIRNQSLTFRERNTRIFVDKFELKDNQRRQKERGAVIDAMAKCGYEPPDTLHRRLPLETWGNYSQHQFAPAPAGVGLDTYRVWEFLFFGTVPIVSASPWAEELFLKSHLPVVIVDDWNEICEWVNNPELYQQLVDAYASWIRNAHHWLKPSLWVPRDQDRMEMLCDMSPGCRESEKRRGRFPTKLSVLRQKAAAVETHVHSSSSFF